MTFCFSIQFQIQLQILGPLLQQAGKNALHDAAVDFSFNTMSDSGVRQLTSLLRRFNIHCKDISLASNYVGDNAVRMLCDYFDQIEKPVEHINLDATNVSVRGLLTMGQRCRDHPRAAYPRFDEKTLTYCALKITLSARNNSQPGLSKTNG